MQYASTIPILKVTRVTFSRRGHKCFTHFCIQTLTNCPDLLYPKVGTYAMYYYMYIHAVVLTEEAVMSECMHDIVSPQK